MATKSQLAERDEAIADLRAIIHPGDTLHTILRHVSASGMMRHIDVIQLAAMQGLDGNPVVAERCWSYRVAKALGYQRSDSRGSQGAIKVGGAGMDMGFNLVYNLSSVLFPDGFDCIGERCPSNDHSNRDLSHHHRDGGYALRQRWL